MLFCSKEKKKKQQKNFEKKCGSIKAFFFFVNV